VKEKSKNDDTTGLLAGGASISTYDEPQNEFDATDFSAFV
jgi:hypothetical protein